MQVEKLHEETRAHGILPAPAGGCGFIRWHRGREGVSTVSQPPFTPL